MSGAETLSWWVAIPLAFLLVLGGLVTLIGAFGLARLQSFYQRIHGPAITITLGTGGFLLASMLYFSVRQSRLVLHELLITGFVLLTAPVVSMLIMRAGLYRELRERAQPRNESSQAPSGKAIETEELPPSSS